MTGPAPADPGDAPRAAWITAYAFTGKSRLQALHAIPGARAIRSAALWFPLLHQTRAAAARGALYLDDTRRCVVICRPDPTTETSRARLALVAILAELSTLAAIIAMAIAQGPLVVGIAVLCVGILVEPITPRALLRGADVDATPLPTGPRWTLTSLASLRNSQQVDATHLAKRVMATRIPDGAVLVVGAHSERLHRAYRKQGFQPATGWPHTRLYKVIQTD